MQLPIELLRSLEGVKGFDEDAFVKVHESGEQMTSIRVNPNKFSIENFQLPITDGIVHASSISRNRHAFNDQFAVCNFQFAITPA